MNKARRKEIDNVAIALNQHRADLDDVLSDIREALSPFMTRLQDIAEAFGSVSGVIEDIKSEEEEYRDNMPDSMQSGDKYSMADEAITELESAVSEVDEMVNEVEGFMATIGGDDNDDPWTELDSKLEIAVGHLETAKGD